MMRKQAVHGFKHMTCFYLLMMLAVSPVVSAEQQISPKSDDTATPDKWQFEISPYFFAAGLYGTTGVRQVQGEVEKDFGDILEDLEMGGMLAVEVRKGSWAFIFDSIYMRLGGQQFKSWQGPGGIGSLTGTLEATTTLQIYQPSLGYRVLDGRTKLDVIGAGRYTQLDADLNLVVTTGGLLPGGSRQVSGKEGWWDPVVGTRVLAPFAQKWAFTGYADIGGFGVGSDLTYQLVAGVKWQFSKVVSMKLDYRYLYQDYEKDGFVWDMAAHGPLLGFGFSF